MSDINIVVLTGRLTRDPEIHYTAKSTPIANLRLAVNRSYKVDEKSDWQKESFFVTVIVMGALEEKVEKSFKKGDLIFVEGRLKVREYENKDKEKKVSMEIIAKNVLKLEAGHGKEVVIEDVVQENEPDVPFS